MAVTPPPSLRIGDSGSAVLDVQARLVALGYPISDDERGAFGQHTESAVKVFQIRRGLTPDGVVADHTWRELVEAGWTTGGRTLYLRRPPMRGDDVRELQRRLNSLGFDAGKEDGIFDVDSQDAVAEFQRNVGLFPPDGIAGHETFEALDRLRRRIGPGSKAELRERIEREASKPGGRPVFLDPGHGGIDTGSITAVGIPEAYIAYRVAESAAAGLRQQGAAPLFSRAVQQGPEVDRRCEIANALGADVAVSFHVACRSDPGPTVAFFSVERTQSTHGRELAEAIGESLRPRLGGVQILGRNLPFLRQTRMPSVVVDLASPGEEPLLAEDPYLVGLGEAVAHGVDEYFATAK
jgi:N-acetylmuramoyl-L-alanine amidase